MSMREFEWIGYDMEDNEVCGGIIQALDKADARKSIEEEIEKNNDDYTECGFFRYEILD